MDPQIRCLRGARVQVEMAEGALAQLYREPCPGKRLEMEIGHRALVVAGPATSAARSSSSAPPADY